MINTLTRTGCTDQRREEGPLYRQGSSRRRLLAAPMEVTGITRRKNASAPLGKPLQHHVTGLTWCLLNATRESRKTNPSDL